MILLTGAGNTWRTTAGAFPVSKQAIESLYWKDDHTVIAADKLGVAYTVQSSGAVDPAGAKPDVCSSRLPVASTPLADLIAIACGNEIRVSDGSIPRAQTHGAQSSIRVVSDVSVMKWSRDGRWLAYGLVDGRAGIFDSRRRTARYYPIPAHNGAVRALAWSSDAKRLATGGSDSEVHVWSPPFPFQVDFCATVHRRLEPDEWYRYVGPDLPFVQPCAVASKP